MNEKIQNIQVLGSGCSTCKKLFELTKLAVSELGIEIGVEHITDIQRIISMGILSSPALVVNEKVLISGKVPNLEEIKQLIKNKTAESAEEEKPVCSCGGNC
ncbi:MAG: thioredoxin family protein [Patescibacteria group bacterium]|nr:thioredoxin family protein [Patescibacteria group bacterium]MDD4303966.1 thioredoxin family protein [Patescibacteria group bacterium]MDD4695045.1 thioredoxin family protein [Patescibacteria group bacterium]